MWIKTCEGLLLNADRITSIGYYAGCNSTLARIGDERFLIGNGDYVSKIYSCLCAGYNMEVNGNV